MVTRVMILADPPAACGHVKVVKLPSALSDTPMETYLLAPGAEFVVDVAAGEELSVKYSAGAVVLPYVRRGVQSSSSEQTSGRTVDPYRDWICTVWSMTANVPHGSRAAVVFRSPEGRMASGRAHSLDRGVDVLAAAVAEAHATIDRIQGQTQPRPTSS